MIKCRDTGPHLAHVKSMRAMWTGYGPTLLAVWEEILKSGSRTADKNIRHYINMLLYLLSFEDQLMIYIDDNWPCLYSVQNTLIIAGWQQYPQNMTQNSLIISPIISIPFKPKGNFTRHFPTRGGLIRLQNPSPGQDLSAGEIQD